MTQDEIIEMARQAGFERLGHTDNDWVCYPEDIKAFANLVAAKALAQTQEPVAWMRTSGTGSPVVTEELLVEMPEMRWNFQKPLYTTPPQRTWVGLTEEEIKPCWYEACQTDLELTSQLVVYFAKAIEAKFKEKNT